MSMKSTTAPRRAYVRNSVYHVLFAGQVFGTKEQTAIKLAQPVKVVGNGDGSVTVSQRQRSHRGSSQVSETWGLVRVPCRSR